MLQLNWLLHLQHDNAGGTIETWSHKIWKLLDFDGSAFKNCDTDRPDAPRTFGLKINGSGKDIIGGNPQANLDPRFVDVDSILYLDMPSLNTTTELIEMNDLKGITLYLLTKSNGMVGDTNCQNFPDPLHNDKQNPNQPVLARYRMENIPCTIIAPHVQITHLLSY